MLKALLLSLTTMAIASPVLAQNLVRNPSFEDTTKCTGWHPLYTEAEYWYNPNMATPDIYDTDLDRQCGTEMGPSSVYYLDPFDGLRFAGGFQWYWGGSNTREYFMSPLLEPLVAGQAYRVSLYYAWRGSNRFAIDRIGVYFGPDSMFQGNPNTLQVAPQVELLAMDSSYLVNTAWTQLADTFVAVGGEQWIIFGTFNDAIDVNWIEVPFGGFNSETYYYFDLVEVVPVEGPNGIMDKPFHGGIEVREGMVHWGALVQFDGALLFDVAGRVVHTWPLQALVPDRPSPLPLSLSNGMYVIAAWGGGSRYSVRFVKEEGGR